MNARETRQGGRGQVRWLTHGDAWEENKRKIPPPPTGQNRGSSEGQKVWNGIVDIVDYLGGVLMRDVKD